MDKEMVNSVERWMQKLQREVDRLYWVSLVLACGLGLLTVATLASLVR